MKIRTAVILFVIGIFANFAALTLSLVHFSDLLDFEARELARAGESNRAAEELKSRLLTHNRNALLYSIHKDPALLESRQSQRSEISHLLGVMGKFTDCEEERAVLEHLSREISFYLKERDRLLDLPLSPLDEYSQVSQIITDITAMIDELIVVNRQQMTDLIKTIGKQNKQANGVAMLFFVLGATILFFSIVAIAVYVLKPMVSLTQVMGEYAEGNHSIRAKVTKGVIEISEISSTFNLMAGSLEEKRREHLEVIAAVAHDIRNPLSSIAMASELLASRSEGKNREMCMIIHRQVNMLDRLVGDLLEGSRIASGQIDLHFATHDLGALIRDCVNLHRSSVSGHEFKLEIQDEPLLCRCDNRLLTQVVNNLISNAVKYSPRGGLVTLKARVENKEIVFEVKDEGIGIEPQDQIDIFKPFHRAKQTKSKYPGVGLGLSTSQAIVEAHEGKLSVKSELGHGTEFTVRISRNNIKKDVPGSPVRLESQNPDSLSEKESSYFN